MIEKLFKPTGEDYDAAESKMTKYETIASAAREKYLKENVDPFGIAYPIEDLEVNSPDGSIENAESISGTFNRQKLEIYRLPHSKSTGQLYVNRITNGVKIQLNTSEAQKIGKKILEFLKVLDSKEEHQRIEDEANQKVRDEATAQVLSALNIE